MKCWWLSLAALASLCSCQQDQPPLKVDVTKAGECGPGGGAAVGDKVTVHYGGFLRNGDKFDSR